MLQVSAISNSNQLWMNHQEGVSEDILHQRFFPMVSFRWVVQESADILHTFNPNGKMVNIVYQEALR
ncbi:hypothetical protein TNCV_4056621 [Trichonephila clavipes]|nr:hypothetical protein TNCV_4056621 [Trichonephila clavipes]